LRGFCWWSGEATYVARVQGCMVRPEQQKNLINNDGITQIARKGLMQRDPFINNLTNKLIRSFYKREGVDNYDDDL